MRINNLQKEYEDYYSAKKDPEIVEFAEATYISILGTGSPGTKVFYEKKKAVKLFVEELEKRFANTENAFISTVIEIFYWYNEEKVGFVDIGDFYTSVDLDLLHYRIAIRIPDYILQTDIVEVERKMASCNINQQYEHFTYNAGKCVQILHSGPFADELETLPVLQDFATINRLKKSGMHHEIHLINFERGQSQDHLQTILRDQVMDN